MFTDPPILCCTKFLSLWMHCLCVCVYVSMSIWYVCVCVCIDLRLGWEPCSVPAWLINGVVMAIGRNEGTKRRRPASLDPCAPPGAHNLTHTHTNSLSMLYTFLTDMLVTQTTLSSCLYCIMGSLTSLLLYIYPLYFVLSLLLLIFFLMVFTLYSFSHSIPPSRSFF